MNLKCRKWFGEQLTAETLTNHSGGMVMVAEAPEPGTIEGRDIFGWGMRGPAS